MEEAGNVRVMTKRSVTQKIVSMFERPENVLMAFMGIVMSIAILGPLVIILLKSFEVQKGLFASVYSLQNYLSFASPRIMKGIGNSFIIDGEQCLSGRADRGGAGLDHGPDGHTVSI